MTTSRGTRFDFCGCAGTYGRKCQKTKFQECFHYVPRKEETRKRRGESNTFFDVPATVHRIASNLPRQQRSSQFRTESARPESIAPHLSIHQPSNLTMSSGPELRCGNITLDSITAPTEVENRHTKILYSRPGLLGCPHPRKAHRCRHVRRSIQLLPRRSRGTQGLPRPSS